MKRLLSDTTNLSDLGERSKQVQSTQDTKMRRIHIIEVDTQVVTAIIAAGAKTTHRKATAIQAAEEALITAEVEETTTVMVKKAMIATQGARQHHLPGPEEEVTEATTEKEKVILRELQ